MNTAIRSFLDDLYEIDPSLKAHEAELVPLIKQLLTHDPGRSPADPGFVEELRTRLERRSRELQHPSPSSFPFMSKFLYTFSGAAVALVVAVPTVYFGIQQMQKADNATSQQPIFAYSVTEAPANAFGSLQNLQVSGTAGGKGGAGGAPTASEISALPAPVASTDAESTALSAVDAPVSDTDAKRVADPMIYPPTGITEYQYVFSGSLPALPQGTVSVLKRERGVNRPALSTFLRSFNLGTVDLGSFGDADLDSLTFSQSTQFGHMITVQLKEGIAMISQNWEVWPHPENACRDEACYQRFRTKIGDIPADAELLRMASAFISEHGINVSTYGEPEVDNQWRRDYERSTDKANYYVPDAVQVVYPQLVEGQPVYDQGGTKAGIRVSISVRHKRVSDVWGLQGQTYVKSEYAAVSDSKEVTDFLSTFERMNPEFMPRDIPVTKTTVTLGTPSLGYATYYAYDKMPAEELIVPALVFPVENVSDGQFFWRQTVVVPLAKELLDQLRSISGGGVPMPLMEKTIAE